MDQAQNNPLLSEREMMDDSMSSQEMMASAYNTCAGECASNQLRSTFLSILNDEHDIKAQLFDEMSARGWYQIKQAEQTEILKTKQKYSVSN